VGESRSRAPGTGAPEPLRRAPPATGRSAPGPPRRPPPDFDPRLRERALDQAVNGLARRFPHASARRRVTPEQRRAALAALAFAVGFAALAPQAAALAGAALAAAAFGSAVTLRLAAPFAPPAFVDAPPLRSSALPVVTLLLPLYREAAALPGLVAAVRAIDYPPGRVDAKLLIEADDAETLAAARALPLDARFEILAPGGPRTKPKALNYGLYFARGSLVAVYDAEDWPDPGQLRAAAAALAADRRLACVQAPLGCYNAGDGWLAAAFALEYAVHFRVWLPLLARLGLPLPLGGTSNHFRRSALRAAGGWDPYNVTEDADLGFRLAERGWRCGLVAPPTAEEAPIGLAAWTRQRSRWIKGFMQTLLVRLRPEAASRRAGWRGAAALWLTLGASVAGAALYAPSMALLAAWGALALAGWSAPPGAVWFAPPAAAALAGLAAAIPAARRADAPGLLRAAPFQPIYWLLHAAAALIALRQMFTRPHHWEKTEHGAADRRPR